MKSVDSGLSSATKENEKGEEEEKQEERKKMRRRGKKINLTIKCYNFNDCIWTFFPSLQINKANISLGMTNFTHSPTYTNLCKYAIFFFQGSVYVILN